MFVGTFELFEAGALFSENNSGISPLSEVGTNKRTVNFCLGNLVWPVLSFEPTLFISSCYPTLTLASVFLPAKIARKHAWLASAVDSLLTIGLGLGIRVLVNITSHSNVGLAGSVVGLWEGLVLYHYLNKWPTVYDPYVAYAARVALDVITMDSYFRLVLILLWTGLGLILSDIAPILWRKSGLRLVWKNLRRDMSSLYTKYSHTKPRSRSRHGSSITTTTISHTSRVSSPSHIRFHHFPSTTSSSIKSSTSSPTKSSTSTPTKSSGSATLKSSMSSVSTATGSSQTTQTILPIPPPRDPHRKLTHRIVPGAFQDDISEASTIPPSVPPPNLPAYAFVPLSMRSRSHPSHASSSSTSILTRRALRMEERAERSERSGRMSDWRTEVSASSSHSPLHNLIEIPDVEPPPRSRPSSSITGQTTPGTRELFLPGPSSIAEVAETQPSLDETPLIPDGATETWETIDDDGRTMTAHETDRPPSYHDEYSYHQQEEEEAEKPLPPAPKIDTKARLRSAMTLRSEIAALQKRMKAVEKERVQAKSNNKSALALQKKVEREQLKAQVEKLKKKHDKRMVSLYNDGEITDRLNLAEFDDETAVEELEKAVETLISSSFEPTATDAAGPSASADSLLAVTTLYVEVDSATKKDAVMRAMNEHGIPVNSDGLTNMLIVTLPRA